MAKRYTPRPDGRFATSVHVGEGNNKKLKIIYGKSQKELKDKVADIKKAGVKEVHNFKVLLDEWLKEKEKTVRFTTFENYVLFAKKLYRFYDENVLAIIPAELQKLINSMHASGYSKSSLKHTRFVFSSVIDHAISKNIKVVNFSKQVKLPKDAAVQDRKPLTEEEFEIVINSIALPFGLFAFLGMFTGLRRGELLALKWNDIDFEKQIISISKSVNLKNRSEISIPKTKSSIRVVPIMNNVADVLLKNKQNNDYFVFGGKTPLTLSMFRRRWDKYLKSAGLAITPHQLRHSYATILYKAKIDPKTAQGLLGHSDFQTTMNIYTHASNSIQQDTFDKLNKFADTQGV